MSAKIRAANQSELVQAGLSFDQVWELQKLARSMHSASERWCNEQMTEKQEQRLERRERRMEARVTEIASSLGWIVYFQGDPRGWPIFLGPADLLRGASLDSAYSRLHGVYPF